MRPTRKLDTRYNRREKYSNFILSDDSMLLFSMLALTGGILYYMGKGIAKVSGREGEDEYIVQETEEGVKVIRMGMEIQKWWV